MYGVQNNVKTDPIRTQKSVRMDEKKILTSGFAGKVIPLAYVPLLREDAVRSGRMRFTFEMAETAELLLNAVNIEVNAHFVPFLAFERFGRSMDRLNRSYKGEPDSDGGAVIPFIDTMTVADPQTNEFFRTMGLHVKPLQAVNSAVVEAYNTVVNFRRKMRSTKLTQRALEDTTLAEAFWKHTTMRHIVPSFDQAMIDGEVALNVVDGRFLVQKDDKSSGTQTLAIDKGFAYAGAVTAVNALWAEMAENGVTVSLSNIDMARKTRAFAQLRTQYQGYDDDYIIDLLMSGIRIPNEALSQPILLAQKSAIFGYNQRYATDGENLDKSATRGAAAVEIAVRTPPMNTGGIILITAEITPEQLFERQKDYFLYTTDTAKYPEYVRDFLDPEPVSVVQNDHVDIDHSDPTGTFGYAPLNHEWFRRAPNIGGKYYRPEVDAPTDEDRQKIWAVETVDPTLTEDFYLCSQMHHKVFADTTSDPFEIWGGGMFQIVGNTVFGPAIREASDDYETILGQVDQSRIDVPETNETEVTE